MLECRGRGRQVGTGADVEAAHQDDAVGEGGEGLPVGARCRGSGQDHVVVPLPEPTEGGAHLTGQQLVHRLPGRTTEREQDEVLLRLDEHVPQAGDAGEELGQPRKRAGAGEQPGHLSRRVDERDAETRAGEADRHAGRFGTRGDAAPDARDGEGDRRDVGAGDDGRTDRAVGLRQRRRLGTGSAPAESSARVDEAEQAYTELLDVARIVHPLVHTGPQQGERRAEEQTAEETGAAEHQGGVVAADADRQRRGADHLTRAEVGRGEGADLGLEARELRGERAHPFAEVGPAGGFGRRPRQLRRGVVERGLRAGLLLADPGEPRIDHRLRALAAIGEVGVGEGLGTVQRVAAVRRREGDAEHLGVGGVLDLQRRAQLVGRRGGPHLLGGELGHTVGPDQLRLGLQVDQLLAPAVRCVGVSLQRVDQDRGVGRVVDALPQRERRPGHATEYAQHEDERDMPAQGVDDEGRERGRVLDVAHDPPRFKWCSRDGRPVFACQVAFRRIAPPLAGLAKHVVVDGFRRQQFYVRPAKLVLDD